MAEPPCARSGGDQRPGGARYIGAPVRAGTIGPYEGRFYTVTGGTHRSSATGRSEVGFPLVVERLEQVADGVAAVTLREPSGGVLPAWGPGAHLDLVLPDGRLTSTRNCHTSPG